MDWMGKEEQRNKGDLEPIHKRSQYKTQYFWNSMILHLLATDTLSRFIDETFTEEI